MIRDSKRNHFNQIIPKLNGDSRKLWKYVNRFKQGKNGAILPQMLHVNGEMVTRELRMANELNKAFIVIPKCDTSRISDGVTNDIVIENYINSRLPIDVTFHIPNVTVAFVQKELSGLNTHRPKASGADNLTPFYLKLCSPVISQVITDLINESIDTCVFPSTWRIAKVKAAFKGGTDCDMDNYRPFSVSCLNC